MQIRAESIESTVDGTCGFLQKDVVFASFVCKFLDQRECDPTTLTTHRGLLVERMQLQLISSLFDSLGKLEASTKCGFGVRRVVHMVSRRNMWFSRTFATKNTRMTATVDVR